jgi:glucose-6-phosphate 1-dehydrogenase
LYSYSIAQKLILKKESVDYTLRIRYTLLMKEMNTHPPLIFVLFGATGDLAQKKILPALLALFSDKLLPKDLSIIAFSRRSWTNKEYHDFIRPSLEVKKIYSQEIIEEFLQHVTYTRGTFDEQEAYMNLKEKINNLIKNSKNILPAQVLYHLAVQPEFYELIAEKLAEIHLQYTSQENISSKLLVEKPFGHNKESAQKLENHLEQYFAEQQIFRIDHYLAKQGLLDLLNTRKSNKDLESRLNSKYVASIHVKFLEKIGIEGRGEFYDSTGALKDVGQNHVLEMLATLAMDLPNGNDKNNSIQDTRAAVLQDLKKVLPKTINQINVMGQYKEYSEETDVSAGSRTETYFKITTEILSERWKDVPVTLEGGKHMSEKRSEVEIIFKDNSRIIFNIEKSEDKPRDAYEILILKALESDKDYFAGIEEIIASWEFIDSVIENKDKIKLEMY